MMEMNKLIQRVPFDVLVNHIIPYTYERKPINHLLDIRSFSSDYKVLQNFIFYDYNEVIILNDLIRFCNNNVAPIYDIDPKYEELLRRHISFNNKSKLEIRQYVFSDFHKRLLSNTEVKIKFLWGLLTNIERTRFLNTYYIVD